jgi:thiosulfate dehydrogenase [quinone] large subunit
VSTRRTLETEVPGRPVGFDYSGQWVGYSPFLLRVVTGWTLFRGGVTRLVTCVDAAPANDWTAAGFPANAIPQGDPLMGVRGSMAGTRSSTS